MKNEFKFNTRGTHYHTKSEKVSYIADREAIVVTLYKGNGFNTVLYRFYEFT
ncbi:hypothetical protein [Chryseobacterium sp. Leaf404]|uniref:hypothetical protein n=1 Tax=Chryseobacterium sp. Leaf404 TaxID=1736366 RepID=UPI000AA49948|nr:hypothetical protein [Chryseobacterium sp. Leaf404]